MGRGWLWGEERHGHPWQGEWMATNWWARWMLLGSACDLWPYTGHWHQERIPETLHLAPSCTCVPRSHAP